MPGPETPPSLQAMAAELRRLEHAVASSEKPNPADARAVARAAASLAKAAAQLKRGEATPRKRKG